MARKRMIDPKIWTSSDFINLTIRQRLLFIGIISNADDRGRLEGDPRSVKAKIFPADDFPTDEIQKDLDALTKSDMIVLYQVKNSTHTYLQVVNFHRYQYIKKPQKSTIPIPLDIAEQYEIPIDEELDQVYSHNNTEPVRNQFGTNSEPAPQKGGDNTEPVPPNRIEKNRKEKKRKEKKPVDSMEVVRTDDHDPPLHEDVRKGKNYRTNQIKSLREILENGAGRRATERRVKDG